MDIAEEIANYLDDAGFGTVGTDIFIGQLPSNTTGVFVVHLGGANDLYTPIERPVLDIYAAYTSANTAVTKLEDIKRYIHRMYDTETTNAVIYSILALGDIEDVDRDLEYNKTFKLSIQLIMRDKTLIS